MKKAAGVQGALCREITIGHWKYSKGYTPQTKNHFSVSDTTDCNRKQVYARRGTPYSNPFTMSTQDRMSKGTGLQDYIRGELIPRNTKWEVLHWSPELLLQMDYDVELADTGEIIRVRFVGKPDGVLREKGKKTYDTGLEVKTTGAIKGLIDSRLGLAEDHWSSSYRIQGNRYLNIWNDMMAQGLLEGACYLSKMMFFLYDVRGFVIKDTGGPFTDFTFEVDREAFVEDLVKRAHVERDLRDGNEGERRVSEPDFWCKGNPEGTGCQYYYKCWGLKKRPPGKPPTLGGVTATKKSKVVRKKAKK